MLAKNVTAARDQADHKARFMAAKEPRRGEESQLFLRLVPLAAGDAFRT